MSGLAQLLFVLVLLGARTALALAPERQITELAHRVWDSKSGVPDEVRALAQTSDGYLWVGSLRGLYRFDGIQFTRFEPESAAHLQSQQIRSLFATADDRLWIGYLKGGVSVLAAGKLINYSSADGFPEGNVRSFAQDQQGRIWAASTGGLASFDGRRWHTVGSEWGYPGSGASALIVDHLGALWVTGEHRVAVLPANASKFELADEPYNGQVYQLGEAPDGTVWMAETTRAIRPLKRPGQDAPYQGLTKDDCQSRFPLTWQAEPRCRRPDDLEVRVGSQAFLFDRDGSFWITTLGDGLRRAPYPLKLPKEPIGESSSALEQFASKDGLSADVAYTIFEDREGSIWVATRDGIDQFRNSTLAPVTLGPTASQVSIVPDRGGDVVVMVHDGEMYRLHDAHNRVNLNSREEESYGLYRDLFGSIWGTGILGGCRFVGGECATRLAVPGEARTNQPWRLAVDGKHQLWAYTSEMGLYAFDNGRWNRTKTIPSALTSTVPTTQYTDDAGRVWFGFRDGKVLTVTDGVLHLYSSEDGLNLGEVRVIYSTGKDVWVGGAGGLARLGGTRFTPVLPYDAPAFGSVSGIVAADDGSLWLNEYRGVIRVPDSEAAAIARDSSHPTHYEIFSAVDGLAGATEQFFISSTAIRGTDGRLWFATTNGVVWVDPQHLYRNKLPPPVVIQSIVADGRTLSPYGKLELPGKTINLQVAYAGLSFSVPERVQFRYRLRGLDQEWQNAGTRRTAYFTRLPAGSYDFQVRAANDTGVWNEVGAELPIRIMPAWYQTWWFYALCALPVVAALAALYRWRLAQVRAETHRLLEARLSERERIARDLHDTLLQGVQGLLLRFQVAAERIPRGEPAREMMDLALERADMLVDEGRARVKGLRASVGSVPRLPQAIARIVEQLAPPDASPFRITVEGAVRELDPIVREELQLLAREALSNAYRHANASKIEAEIVYADDGLTVRIRDDGQGIDGALLREGRPGHYGLLGMRERAKKLRARLGIWSKPGAGTEVEVRVPAAIAYRESALRSRRPAWWRKASATEIEDTTL